MLLLLLPLPHAVTRVNVIMAVAIFDNGMGDLSLTFILLCLSEDGDIDRGNRVFLTFQTDRTTQNDQYVSWTG